MLQLHVFLCFFVICDSKLKTLNVFVCDAIQKNAVNGQMLF